MIKVALLTTDSREHFKDYANTQPYFGTAPEALLEGFKLLPAEVEVHVVSCFQKMPASSPTELAENIYYHSLLVPKVGWLRTGYQGCIRAVGKKLREIQPDLVHAQGTERDCALSAVFAPYPRVLTIHGNLRLVEKAVGFRPFSALWLQARLEAFAVPRFDGVVCISSYTREAVDHETPKTWIIPNAVNPYFFDEGRRRVMSQANTVIGPTQESPVILVVANVCPWKNQNNFIRALDTLGADKPFNVKFFGSCGDDVYSREFQAMVATRPWCQYGGFIKPAALATELRRAAFLALPTLEENFGMVIIEAQAAGVPVMASNVGGIPDLIEDQVTGLLINPRDPESIRKATDRLLSDDELRRTLAVNAHHRAMETYHPKVIAQKHLNVYREVLQLAVQH